MKQVFKDLKQITGIRNDQLAKQLRMSETTLSHSKNHFDLDLMLRVAKASNCRLSNERFSMTELTRINRTMEQCARLKEGARIVDEIATILNLDQVEWRFTHLPTSKVLIFKIK